MPLASSSYLNRRLRARPVRFRFQASIWNRERQHEVDAVWARDLAAAYEQARDTLAGTGCELVAVDPTWDALVTADGRQVSRQEWEAMGR